MENMKQPSLRQEAIRLGFAFLALLIVGLMTNTATSDANVQLVVVEQPKKKLPKILVVPEKSAAVAAVGKRYLVHK